MLSETANNVILVLFGVFLGVALQLFYILLLPKKLRRWHPDQKVTSGRTLEERLTQAEEELKAEHSGTPRSARIALIAVYSIVGLFLLTIDLTPVRMAWVPLLIASLVGFGVTLGVFQAAKAGRFRRPQ